MQPSRDTPAAPERAWLIRLLIIAAAVLFIGTISLLYFRWLHIQEPTSVLVLNGTDALEGATVQLTGVNLADPITATFTESDRYTLKFFLEAGSYSISIKRGGTLLQAPEEFSLPGRTQLTVNLAREFPSTRPSGRLPGVR